MHDRVGLELHAGLDPGRGWVEDRHAGVHVREVDPVAKRCRGGGELGAGVHALGLGRVVGEMSHDALAAAHEIADGVGQVELALRVVRLEPVQGRPEQVGPEDVDRGVALAKLELLGRRVSGLHDRLDGPVFRRGRSGRTSGRRPARR